MGWKEMIAEEFMPENFGLEGPLGETIDQLGSDPDDPGGDTAWDAWPEWIWKCVSELKETL